MMMYCTRNSTWALKGLFRNARARIDVETCFICICVCMCKTVWLFAFHSCVEIAPRMHDLDIQIMYEIMWFWEKTAASPIFWMVGIGPSPCSEKTDSLLLVILSGPADACSFPGRFTLPQMDGCARSFLDTLMPETPLDRVGWVGLVGYLVRWSVRCVHVLVRWLVCLIAVCLACLAEKMHDAFSSVNVDSQQLGDIAQDDQQSC